MTDLIRRADAIEELKGAFYFNTEDCRTAIGCIKALPSAEAVQGYTEWLEKIIVEAETIVWLCEDTNNKEWCDENCKYSSIQAECLRHLYEVSKGGGTE